MADAYSKLHSTGCYGHSYVYNLFCLINCKIFRYSNMSHVTKKVEQDNLGDFCLENDLHN